MRIDNVPSFIPVKNKQILIYALNYYSIRGNPISCDNLIVPILTTRDAVHRDTAKIEHSLKLLTSVHNRYAFSNVLFL